jgi:hypothetical protein
MYRGEKIEACKRMIRETMQGCCCVLYNLDIRTGQRVALSESEVEKHATITATNP